MPRSADPQPELALQGSLFGEPEPPETAAKPSSEIEVSLSESSSYIPKGQTIPKGQIIPKGQMLLSSNHYLGEDKSKYLHSLMHTMLPLLGDISTQAEEEIKAIHKKNMETFFFVTIKEEDIRNKNEYRQFYRYHVWKEGEEYCSIKLQEKDSEEEFIDGSFLQWASKQPILSSFNLPTARYIIFEGRTGKRQKACLIKGYRQDRYAQTESLEEGYTVEDILKAYLENVRFFSVLFKFFGITFEGHFQAVHKKIERGESYWVPCPYLFGVGSIRYRMGHISDIGLKYPNVSFEGPRDFGNIVLDTDTYYEKRQKNMLNGEKVNLGQKTNSQSLMKLNMLTEAMMGAILHGLDLYYKDKMESTTLKEFLINLYAVSIDVFAHNNLVMDRWKTTKEIIKMKWGENIFDQIICELDMPKHTIKLKEPASIETGRGKYTESGSEFVAPTLSVLNLVWHAGIMLSLNGYPLLNKSQSVFPPTGTYLTDYYACLNLHQSLKWIELKKKRDERLVKRGLRECRSILHKGRVCTPIDIPISYMSDRITEGLLREFYLCKPLEEAVKQASDLLQESKQRLETVLENKAIKEPLQSRLTYYA